MREPRDFRIILERLDEIFPGRNTLTAEDMASYCGVTDKTIRKYGFNKYTDKVTFARWLCEKRKEKHE